MTGAQKRTVFTIVLFSALCGCAFSMLPLMPLTKMMICAAGCIALGVVMLVLGIYEVQRRVHGRPSICWTWLSFSAGFCAIGVCLWMMARYWDAPRGQRPDGLVFEFGCVGAIFLLIGLVTMKSCVNWQLDKSHENR